MLIERVEGVLEGHGYEHCRCAGCFDVAARRSDLLLLKVLANIDSLQRSHSESLRALSHALSATPAVVGDHTSRDRLCDGTLYERFSLFAFTPATLDAMLSGGFPRQARRRGGLFVGVSAAALREARLAKHLTQRQLAERIGTTKKSVYEHESGDKKMRLEYAKRAEDALGREITKPLEIAYDYASVEPLSFEKLVLRDFAAIGMSAAAFHHAAFNIVASDSRALILSEAEEDAKLIKRRMPYVKAFSSLTKMPALAVTRSYAELDIPSVTEKELAALSRRDLRRIVR